MKDQNKDIDYGAKNGGLSEFARFPAQEVKLLLTEQEAAVALGISRRTLWTLRNTGQIPAVRIGKCVRYSVAALHDWIEKRNQSGNRNLPR